MTSTNLLQRVFNKNLLVDIRFWILAFALLRLYGITYPPLEVAHNWRQTTVTMVARNFYEISPDILHPRIDIAGDKTGITGMEFPLFNYLIYLVSLFFGYEHWYGRLINLAVSSLGIFFFFKLAKKYFRPDIAFYAAFILLVSFWFSYSRKIMPDTFASSLVLISLYYGSNYLDKKASNINLLFYFLFGLAGMLAKLPVAYFWIFYAILFYSKDVTLRKKFIFSIVSVTLAIPVYYWYFIWVPHLVEAYGFWHFYMGDPFVKGIKDAVAYYPRILNHFYESAIRYSGFIMMLTGIFYAFFKKNRILRATFFLSLFAFTLIVFKSGRTFAFHSYYIIPFIPVLALFAAFGISQIQNKKIVYGILMLISIEGLLNQWNDFVIKPDEKALTHLETDLNKVSNHDDLIVINSNNVPTPMYFAHRKGWVTSNENLLDKLYLETLKEKGCEFILVLKNTFGEDIPLNKEILFENEHYKVYKN